MKTEKNKVKNPIKLAGLVAVSAFVGIYAWMILLHVGVEVYESKKLGSRELGKTIGEQLFNNNIALIIIPYVVMEIIILLIAALMVKRYNQEKLKLDHFGMKVDSNSFKQIIYGFGIVAVMYILVYLPMYAFGIVEFKGYGFSDQSLLNVIGTVLLILFTTAFPGFCEEIVFRGVIQKHLMKKMSTPVAVIISSICFSVLHIGRYSDFMSLFCIVVIGSVFGFIFAKTKSLYLSIGIHYAWDFFGSIIGSGKSMFNTNFILVFQNTKNYDFLSSLITIIVFVILLVAVMVKYKVKDIKLPQLHINII